VLEFLWKHSKLGPDKVLLYMMCFLFSKKVDGYSRYKRDFLVTKLRMSNLQEVY
jgi:hypothetical protein